MSSIRKLLSENNEFEIKEIEEIDLHLNCVNGYFIENTTICICYPGWTSVYNSFDLCTEDSGENNTNTYKKEGVIYSNDEPKEKATSPAFIIFLIIIILLVLGIFCAIFMCLFKKYKDIKLLKEKIKYEKKRNKNWNQSNSNIVGEKGKDINCKEDNKENKKDMVCLGVINETDLYSYKDNEINE